MEVKLPSLGENIEQGDVLRVMVSAGDVIRKDQAICELETDKAALEVPSPVEGKITEVRIKEGQKVKVGEVLLVVAEDGVAAKPEEKEKERRQEPPKPEPEPEPEPPKPAPPPPPRGVSGPASPSVRRFAREIGIDLAGVSGSGPRGRISIEDVKAYAKALNEGRVAPAAGAAPSAALPDFAKWGGIEREAMSSVRRKTMEHMTRSWTHVAHVTQFDEADITGLEELRKRLTPKAEKQGGKVTVTAIALKVAASALTVFPKFNASIDAERQEVVLKKYVHIGVAVDTDRGLLVPVIRDVDRKGIVELSIELSRIAERARARKLTLEEMQGGCFTITNLGGIGGTHFTPIVNWPEVAILALGRASLRPVFVNGEFTPRLIMPIGLSYDHRLIDGADAARFIRWISEALAQPYLMVEG